MKPRIAIAAVVGAVLCPSIALCAEGGERAEPGTWLGLLFYTINFGIFIWLLAKFAGPAIAAFFRSRAAGVRESLGKSDEAYREAQRLAGEAAERMAGVEAEKARIQSDLAEETVFQIGRIYDLAHESAARIKRDA